MAMCKRCHRALYQKDYDAGEGYCLDCQKLRAQEAKVSKPTVIKPKKVEASK